MTGFVLKMLRSHIRLTQDQFAESLHVDLTTVQGWESGRRPLMAASTGTYLRIRNMMICRSVPAPLIRQLDVALEADRFLGYVMSQGNLTDLEDHPLATWVINRPFTDLVSWPLTGIAPSIFEESASKRPRGPSPSGPQLRADEKAHVAAHFREAVEKAPQTSKGALLRRQGHYLAGFDNSQDAKEWLASTQRSEQRLLHPGQWSPSWAVVRSGAHSLARQGDESALSRFVDHHLESEDCEVANLNYWAYWLGEIDAIQITDTFMIDLNLQSWRGWRMVAHLITKMNSENPYLDVVIHTMWALITCKPNVVTPDSAGRLSAAAKRLLDEEVGSPRSQRELNEVLYALRLMHSLK